jgi:hypothetical protein
MKLGTFVDVLDVMNHAKFHLHKMNILRSSGGHKRGFPFEMHMALTTLPCATALASDICCFWCVSDYKALQRGKSYIVANSYAEP